MPGDQHHIRQLFVRHLDVRVHFPSFILALHLLLANLALLQLAHLEDEDRAVFPPAEDEPPVWRNPQLSDWPKMSGHSLTPAEHRIKQLQVPFAVSSHNAARLVNRLQIGHLPQSALNHKRFPLFHSLLFVPLYSRHFSYHIPPVAVLSASIDPLITHHNTAVLAPDVFLFAPPQRLPFNDPFEFSAGQQTAVVFASEEIVHDSLATATEDDLLNGE